VHIGAIVTIPVAFSSANTETRWAPIARWELLGTSVLAQVVGRLRVSGINEISLLPEITTGAEPNFLKSVHRPREWDSVISRYLSYGMETLLLVRIGAYVEVDFRDFLRFHREGSKSISQVFDGDGALDLWAIEADRLKDDASWGFERRGRYRFNGYTNRLWDAHDFRRLAEDALFGRAAIPPIGKEIAPNVWSNDAWIDPSAQIIGPAYIGKQARVHASCRISGATSVEQQCELDCGTTVHGCCILPRTYLGVALNVRDAIVSEHTLFHLGREVEIHFHDSRFMGSSPAKGHPEQLPSNAAPGSEPYQLPGPNWHL
jgi:hypothetical protein